MSCRGGSSARNRTINRVRARVEHAFAGIAQIGGKRVGDMTLARNTLVITMQCVATDLERLVWLATR